MNDIVIDGQETLRGTTTGQLVIEAGGEALVLGTHLGGAEVKGGGTLTVRGSLMGGLAVRSDGAVQIDGEVLGGVSIESYARVVVGRAGRLAGGIQNSGELIVQGLLAGPVGGREAAFDGGRALEPRIDKDGGIHYDLPPR
jgi:hypothetical protein